MSPLVYLGVRLSGARRTSPKPSTYRSPHDDRGYPHLQLRQPLHRNPPFFSGIRLRPYLVGDQRFRNFVAHCREAYACRWQPRVFARAFSHGGTRSRWGPVPTSPASPSAKRMPSAAFQPALEARGGSKGRSTPRATPPPSPSACPPRWRKASGPTCRAPRVSPCRIGGRAGTVPSEQALARPNAPAGGGFNRQHRR